MVTQMLDFYQTLLRDYQNLNSLYQNFISAAIIGASVWLGKILYTKAVSTSKRLIKVRDVNCLFRYWIRNSAVRDTDVRKVLDGYFFLLEQAYTPIIYIGFILSFYWGVTSLTGGNIVAALISVVIILLLRESKMWLTKTHSEKEINKIDAEFKEKILKGFDSIDYKSK